jgi:hypothetical protein
VTFLGATMVVVMLTEILSLGLRGGDRTWVALLLAVIAARGGLQTLAVRCSPSALPRAVDSARGA